MQLDGNRVLFSFPNDCSPGAVIDAHLNIPGVHGVELDIHYRVRRGPHDRHYAYTVGPLFNDDPQGLFEPILSSCPALTNHAGGHPGS